MSLQKYVGDKYTGLSTDPKPSNVIAGANFYELDSLKHYVWVGEQWKELTGTSGYSGSGVSGYSGFSGLSGHSGFSGISGYSGFSGISGYSGFSGVSGYSGFSGTDGYSGYSGASGYSGFSGISGYSGTSGYSGFSGISGYSGFSGVSGHSGYSGSGVSGYSGYSGSQANLTNVNDIQFNTTPTVPGYIEGRIYYDATNKTMAADIGNNVTLQIGEEELRRVYNNNPYPIENGWACYTTGVGSDGIGGPIAITIKPGHAETEDEAFILGVSTEIIAPNSYGFITVRGDVHDMDTNEIGGSYVLSQGMIFRSFLSGPSSNSYTLEVINSGGAGLSYTDTAGAVVINLGGTTGKTNIDVATMFGITPSSVVEPAPKGVVALSVAAPVSFAGGVNTAAGDVLYLHPTVPGEFTTVIPPAPYFQIRLGRILFKSATVGIINVRITPLYRLDDLADVSVPAPASGNFLRWNGVGWVNSTSALTDMTDVAVASPAVDQVLRWNGVEWINGAPVAVSAGVGVVFYPSEIPEYTVEVGSLLKEPPTEGEQIEPAVVNNSTNYIDAYIYGDALGVTQIDAGRWTMYTYGYCSDLSGDSEIIASIAHIIVETGTLTTTGTGTTRTATVTGSTPFIPADYNADATLTSALITVSGSFDVAGYTSNAVLTINTPSGYVNETGVSFKIARVLFSLPSGKITSTSVGLLSSTTVQPAFAVNATDSIGIAYYARTTNTSNTTVTLVHSGADHCSSFLTPLVIRHNDLSGLQGGIAAERYHLTLEQQSHQLPPAVAGYSGQVLTNNGTTTAWAAASALLGTSGYSGYSGTSGYSGYSGSGTSGYSGFSGRSGYSGYSGASGYSGYSGSGVSGYSGFSGVSGYSGFSGISGYSGFSGGSGYSGTSGYSGFSGISGYSGYSGTSGYSGFSGFSGYSGVTPGVPQYGECYFAATNAAATTITTAGTYYKIAGTTTAGTLNSFTSATTNRLTYTGTVTQDFLVTCSAALNGNTVGVMTMAIAKNGVADTTTRCATDVITTGVNRGTSCEGIISLAHNDYIEAWITHTVNGATVTATTMTLVADPMSSMGISGFSGVSGYSGYSGTSGYSGFSGVASIFGNEFTQGVSEADSNTTSITNQTKLTVAFTPVATANYIVNWYAEVDNTNSGVSCFVSVFRDATLIGGELQMRESVANYWVPVSGFRVEALTASTAYSYTIQYRAGANTAHIRDARIAIWRVS